MVEAENKIYEIDGGSASAVLISHKNYEDLQETIELLSISGLRESLQRSLDQVCNNETYSFTEVLGSRLMVYNVRFTKEAKKDVDQLSPKLK